MKQLKNSETIRHIYKREWEEFHCPSNQIFIQRIKKSLDH